MKKTIDLHPDSKIKILLSAKKEFADKGFTGARMGNIARNAGVNQALIHYYFNSKENLYTEVLYHLMGITKADYIRQKLADWNLAPDVALHVAIYLLVYIHLDASDPDINKIIAREITEDNKNLKAIIKNYLIPRLSGIEQILQEGIKQGFFETKNSLLVVMQMITFVLSYHNSRDKFLGTDWYERLYHKDTKHQLYEFLLDHTFKGLTPSNKKVKIPAIPVKYISALETLINEIKEEQSWIKK